MICVARKKGINFLISIAIKIYDVLGRLRTNRYYNRVSNVKVNISDLASGLYFVEIIMSNRSVRRNLSIKR
ncbi:T9SS type A sorting domain-containing protein [Niastella sp. OAS944]|uniref:T9SS type A sorting domain-containing protein n=1 Tax=Niastella sp. OAS944 TaxID=2664089 RepID=UPI0035C871B8